MINLNNLQIDTDYGRDLYEMSNIFLHKVVWLGPHLSPGLSASPIYYYLYYPSLWLTGGDIRGPIYFNIMIAIIALALFLYVLYKQHRQILLTIMTSLLLLTSPIWYSLAYHPGNGFTYALVLILGLTTTILSKKLWISSFFFGIATAMHPASVLSLPLLLAAYINEKANWRQIAVGLLAYVSPWTPIIVFEIITKGFLLRQWLSHPGLGIGMTILNIDNLQIMASQLGLYSAWLLLVPTILIAFDKKTNLWEKLTLAIGFIFFSNLATVPEHYLFGFTVTYLFIVFRWLVNRKYLAMLVITMWLIANIFIPREIIVPTRPLWVIEQTVQTIVTSDVGDKKIATLAVLPSGTSVPQADDYRGLLRMKGLNVVELADHGQADVLIYVVEQPGFNYEHWSTWETEQFGPKKILKVVRSGEVEIVFFTKL